MIQIFFGRMFHSEPWNKNPDLHKEYGFATTLPKEQDDTANNWDILQKADFF